jgi:hypothetical protein
MGAGDQARRQFGVNPKHAGDPEYDTGDFPDTIGQGPGNLRVDYVLPSRGLPVVQSGVFWPLPYEPGARAVAWSDHRLVWVDLGLR